MAKNRKIEVKGVVVSIAERSKEDYISLSDIANGFDGGTALIEKWIRNKNTIEFLAVWERLNNPNFNNSGHNAILDEVGTNRFIMSVKKWGILTNAIGLIASAGRYGGTFARKEIAIEFAAWLNPVYKIEIINKVISIDESYEKLFENLFDESPDANPTDRICHVYLMQDRSNHYYKIGSSKHPIFREKTLQSEKPTILMIFSKSFPNKRDAYNFEQKVHKCYENKRVRGEWFDLSSSDIQELEKTFQS